MVYKRTMWRLIACVAPLATASMASPHNDAASLMSRGRTLLRDGKPAEAAQAFESAAATQPQMIEALFNAGCAHAGAGEWERAEKMFTQVDQEAHDERLRARARYNLGHAAFQAGLSTANSQPRQAREKFIRAAALFQSAYLADPSHLGAARNTELARLAIKRIDDQLAAQQAQEQQQHEQRQQQADQLQELAQRQQELAERARHMNDSSQLTPEDIQRQSEELLKDQGELREAVEKVLEEMNDSREQPHQSESPSTPSAHERVERAVREQADAERDLGEQRPRDAQPKQSLAAEMLRRAAEQLSEQAQPQDGKPNQDQPNQPTPDGKPSQSAEANESSDKDQAGEQELTPEQRLLRELLERERREREARQRTRPPSGGGRVQPVPVERDW